MYTGLGDGSNTVGEMVGTLVVGAMVRTKVGTMVVVNGRAIAVDSFSIVGDGCWVALMTTIGLAVSDPPLGLPRDGSWVAKGALLGDVNGRVP